MARFLLPVALLVLLTGCVGAPVATDEIVTATTETTASETSTTTTQTTSSHDCNASLYTSAVESVPDDESITEYDEMPADRQSEFDRELNGGVSFGRGTEAYWFWKSSRYVEKGNTTYQTFIVVC
ncbi:hypothetical protein ACFQJC_05465 [Haloferax namakaokahaiae]|uniref:DUF7979 domain-containing protein n=1 Tax=Haloferax namakaokahaiae TaxID=1748331 RepID=A0ABD5ZCP3_9EURY